MKNKLHNAEAGLKKGDRIELNISAIDEDGIGIAVYGSTQVRVSRTLPGDRVIATVTYVSQHRITADRIKVLEPAKSRKKPDCMHVPHCDACPLIEMKYTDQLEWKKGNVANHIRQHKALTNTVINPVVPSPLSLHYRNSAKLVISGKFSNPRIGIYRRDSHEVVDLSSCSLHHPLINKIIAVVRKGITKGKIPVYNPKSEHGLLRYLVIRIAENENSAMVVIVTAKRSYNELHHLSAYLCKEVPEVKVVAQNVNPSPGNVIFGNNDFFLTKRTSLAATIANTKFMISPRSFFQVNTGSASKIYTLVKELSSLNKESNVLDLYCGIGAISLFLAPLAQGVLGIEVVESAVEDARENAKLNNLSNCQFESGDVLEELDAVLNFKVSLDLVVLNPPRKGCEEKVLQKVADLSPKNIIYISCSPSSLGRDLALLHSLGFECTEITPVDMFPQTTHIESVAQLHRI